MSGIREVTQTILFAPELNARGVYGNCLQAAIAVQPGHRCRHCRHAGRLGEPAGASPDVLDDNHDHHRGDGLAEPRPSPVPVPRAQFGGISRQTPSVR